MRGMQIGSVVLRQGQNSLTPLCASLLLKIQEQVERTVHLIELLPVDGSNWKPAIPGAWPVEVLLGHLLDCLAGFCAVLAASEPERLGHFSDLRNLPVNHACSPADAVARIGLYRARIQEGFALLDDAGLARTLATVFAERGETLLTLFLGNLEHLINHKHQLFTYLKEMGVPVESRDLYRFRE
jgi:DinB superfamily